MRGEGGREEELQREGMRKGREEEEGRMETEGGWRESENREI